jgi:hypothetical protein
VSVFLPLVCLVPSLLRASHAACRGAVLTCAEAMRSRLPALPCAVYAWLPRARILAVVTASHSLMVPPSAAAHYSCPAGADDIVSIADKWKSYHGKSTVICCNNKLDTQA